MTVWSKDSAREFAARIGTGCAKVEILDDKIEAVNRAGDREFRKLAAKIKRHSEALDTIGEGDMGLLVWSLAAKFHRASKELRELNHTMQQVVTEMDRRKP